MPLHGEREYVQCGFCRCAFKPSVLETRRAGAPLGENAAGRAPLEADTELGGAAASRLLVWEPDTPDVPPVPSRWASRPKTGTGG